MGRAEIVRKTILVVDDDMETRDLLEKILDIEGYTVALAPNGEEALVMLHQDYGQKFDLVIMDLMMPGDGGYSIITQMQGPEYQHVPVVVSSSRVLDQGTVDMICSESNVLEFCPKPLDVPLFRTKLRVLLQND